MWFRSGLCPESGRASQCRAGRWDRGVESWGFQSKRGQQKSGMFHGRNSQEIGIRDCMGWMVEDQRQHPRTQKMIDSKQIAMRPEVQFLKPMGFNDYNALQMKSYAVLSDSGTISEESSILNFPALNIRDAHERPEAMEEASVMMVGLNPERIMQGLTQLQYQKRGKERKRV